MDEKTLIKFFAMALFIYIALATFMFAGLSYAGGNQLWAIIATGMLSAALLLLQAVVMNVFRRPITWKPRIAGKTAVVGVAIHYSAMIIGVSFGAAFSEKSGSIGGIIAVLIQQVVLTYASWILVNQFRQSYAVSSDPKEQGG